VREASLLFNYRFNSPLGGGGSAILHNKTNRKGTGLSLSFSYDIIKAHGGEIKVETKEDKGADFKIKLSINALNENTPSHIMHGRCFHHVLICSLYAKPCH
jgi:signal transduction histidine kinase